MRNVTAGITVTVTPKPRRLSWEECERLPEVRAMRQQGEAAYCRAYQIGADLGLTQVQTSAIISAAREGAAASAAASKLEWQARG